MKKQYLVPLPTKINYGLGSVAEGVKNATFSTFLLFFYTQVVGLSGSLAGTAIALALVVDAITDPLIGNISDNFRSRWGRRHPFMYIAPLPMALCFILLFQPPETTSQTTLFLWMMTFAIGVRSAMTFFMIPSNSLVAELTSNYDERTSLTSFRVLSGWIGALLAIQAGYLYFFAQTPEGVDGRLVVSAYSSYAMAGGVVIVLAIMICAIGTHHLIPKLKLPPDNGPFTFRRLQEDFRDAFTNRAFLTLIISILTAFTAVGLTDALGLYVNTYFWEFTTQQLSLTVFGGLAGTVGAFILTAPMTARFDKRSMALATLAVIVFIGPLPVLLRLVDLMPANGHPGLIWIIVAHATTIVFVAVSIGIVVGSMIADTIDQNDLRTGKRQEGMFNAALGFTAKATSGLGGFVAGVTLDLIDFPTGARPGEVPAETIYKLGLAVGPGILIFWLASLALMRNYRLTREDHRQIIFEITERDNKLLERADLEAAASRGSADPAIGYTD